MTTTDHSAPAASPADGDSPQVDPVAAELMLHLLTGAAHAHHLYEVELGGPHDDWAPWYAQHMARALTGTGYRITRTATP